MIRLCYITIILLITNCDVFAQTANANITATISTPVGMEVSKEINSTDISVMNILPAADYNTIANKKLRLPLVNIIGKNFSHTVTLEEYNGVIDRNKNNLTTFYSQKKYSFVNVTVNFD